MYRYHILLGDQTHHNPAVPASRCPSWETLTRAYEEVGKMISLQDCLKSRKIGNNRNIHYHGWRGMGEKKWIVITGMQVNVQQSEPRGKKALNHSCQFLSHKCSRHD